MLLSFACFYFTNTQWVNNARHCSKPFTIFNSFTPLCDRHCYYPYSIGPTHQELEGNLWSSQPKHQSSSVSLFLVFSLSPPLTLFLECTFCPQISNDSQLPTSKGQVLPGFEDLLWYCLLFCWHMWLSLHSIFNNNKLFLCQESNPFDIYILLFPVAWITQGWRFFRQKVYWRDL